jgi:hypothetical protein
MTTGEIIYNGHWSEGKKSGNGTYFFDRAPNTKLYYTGNWENDLKSGDGKLVSSNGTIYSGSWANN